MDTSHFTKTLCDTVAIRMDAFCGHSEAHLLHRCDHSLSAVGERHCVRNIATQTVPQSTKRQSIHGNYVSYVAATNVQSLSHGFATLSIENRLTVGRVEIVT